MDALALLCNLHANGAQTLQGLRARGCESLDELCAWALEDIAIVLGSGETLAAERLIDHAKALELRLTGRALVPAGSGARHASEGSSEHPISLVVEDGRGDDEPLAPPPSSEPENPGIEPTVRAGTLVPQRAPGGPPRPYVDRDPMVNVVLQTWEELDGARASVAPKAAPTPAAVQPDVRVAHPLRIEQLEGLESDTHARLREAGLITVEALVELDALELARRTGLAFTRARRLQFLARRSLG